LNTTMVQSTWIDAADENDKPPGISGSSRKKVSVYDKQDYPVVTVQASESPGGRHCFKTRHRHPGRVMGSDT
jgi:hypothetical protein